MEYISELMWLCTWPLVILLSYKFIRLNLRQLDRLEKLEKIEENTSNNKNYY